MINRVFASPLDEGKFSPNSSGDIQVIYICNIESQPTLHVALQLNVPRQWLRNPTEGTLRASGPLLSIGPLDYSQTP